jgi:hypothetical protein
MKRWLFAPLLGALLGAIAGCGGSGPKKFDVSGTVTFDGVPVADGDLTFTPEDKSRGAEGGKIKDGKYTMKAHEGKNKIQIIATRIVPGKKGAMGEDFIEQYIPAKFNEKSDLSADVGAGKTEHNFDLKN